MSDNSNIKPRRSRPVHYLRWTLYYALEGLEILWNTLEMLWGVLKIDQTIEILWGVLKIEMLWNILKMLGLGLAIIFGVTLTVAFLAAAPSVWLNILVYLFEINHWFGFLLAGGGVTILTIIVYAFMIAGILEASEEYPWSRLFYPVWIGAWGLGIVIFFFQLGKHNIVNL